MERILLKPKGENELRLFKALMEKMNVDLSVLDEQELEDLILQKEIDEGRKSGNAPRDDIMKELDS